jgi:hypothetical protein
MWSPRYNSSLTPQVGDALPFGRSGTWQTPYQATAERDTQADGRRSNIYYQSISAMPSYAVSVFSTHICRFCASGGSMRAGAAASKPLQQRLAGQHCIAMAKLPCAA